MMKPGPIYKSRPLLAFGFFLFTFFSITQALPLSLPPDDSCFVYPSPASGNTAWVVYNMPSSGTALVLVYNESGDLVAQVQETKPAGPQQQTGLDLFYYRKGIYLCRVLLTLDNGGTQWLKVFKFMVIK
jgi:hypothetical protein